MSPVHAEMQNAVSATSVTVLRAISAGADGAGDHGGIIGHRGTRFDRRSLQVSAFMARPTPADTGLSIFFFAWSVDERHRSRAHAGTPLGAATRVHGSTFTRCLRFARSPGRVAAPT